MSNNSGLAFFKSRTLQKGKWSLPSTRHKQEIVLAATTPPSFAMLQSCRPAPV